MCTTPRHGNAGKPHQGDGAEKLADAAGAVLLHHEEAQQNHQGNGNDEPVQRGGNHLHALNGRQHRNGGRDHTIPIEKTGAKYANQQQNAAQLRAVFDRL
jgi:hypothetical protein